MSFPTNASTVMRTAAPLLLGLSACLNVIDGKLLLGRWQRVFLAELDGPREREVSVVILGEAGR